MRGPRGSGRVTAPPEPLVRHWEAAGVTPRGAAWRPLSGGRTNAVWMIDAAAGPDATALVCKLYRPGGETPLFGNDPAAERCALEALAGSGLGPRLVGAETTPAGPSLVYAHVAGRPWMAGDDPAPVARALATLHRHPAPSCLAHRDAGAAGLAAEAAAMLDEIGPGASALTARRPPVPDLPPAEPVFLHGDATAGNALVTDHRITFIDWQCPVRGDATEDLACFLSPAMQVLSGNRPLSATQRDAFLAAYGDDKTVARHRALAPLYHWRMAAYCLWRAARGDAGYGAAATHETEALTAASRSTPR